jgi:hypothetical protein
MKDVIGTKASHGLTGRLITLPGAPATLFAYKSAYVSATSTTNIISWTAPTNPGNGIISNYKLEHWNGSTWTAIYTGPLLTYTHSGVNETATCFYRISATNQLGYGTTRQVTQSIVVRTSGTTFTVPSTTNRLAILCVGGGTGSNFAGGGGGGIALSYGISVTPGSNATYSVGAGTASGSGATAGTSSVTIGTTALSATGAVYVANRGGSSGSGTVSQGTPIFTSTSNLGGTTSQTTFGGTSYTFGTTYSGFGGGASTVGVGGNGSSSTSTGTGGAGAAARTYFGYALSAGGGGYGFPGSNGASPASSYGKGGAYSGGNQSGQSGAVVFLYFS